MTRLAAVPPTDRRCRRWGHRWSLWPEDYVATGELPIPWRCVRCHVRAEDVPGALVPLGDAS